MSRAVVILALAACGAGRGHKADAGPDGGFDSSVERDGEADADLPDQVGCEGYVPDGVHACVPAGPFWFGWVVDEETCPNCDGRYMGNGPYNNLAHALSTSAFLIDIREVSVGEYAEFLESSGHLAPPEYCEVTQSPVRPLNGGEKPCDVQARLGETGFEGDGTPRGEWLGRPAVCVTKEDARAFCTWRDGGRLPLSTEWMKAARGPLPSTREFPWVEGVVMPWGGAGAYNPFRDLPDGERCALECHVETCAEVEAAPTEPVDSRPENASPYGLLHALGNALEWVEPGDTDDGYEEYGVDLFGFGENRFFFGNDFTQISYGIPAERGYQDSVIGFERDRIVGFRCAHDLP